MAKDQDKTNVMRVLDQKKIGYQAYSAELPEAVSGVEMAELIGKAPELVYKTLVTQGKSKNFFVFVIPVAKELDLKKAAKAVGEKSIEMIPLKNLLPLTGYVHGGCSPIGMKKQFKTVVDQSAESLETITFSAGKIGYQVELAPSDLKKAVPFSFADVTV